MKSTVVKRSIVICGHKTSISLEEPFWCGLKEIAKSNKATLSSVVADIESGRQYGNLSSAIRLFVLAHSRAGAQISTRNPTSMSASLGILKKSGARLAIRARNE